MPKTIFAANIGMVIKEVAETVVAVWAVAQILQTSVQTRLAKVFHRPKDKPDDCDCRGE